MDNLSVPEAAAVEQWLAEHKERIEVFYLPKYVPQQNPDEYLNSDVKGNFVGTDVAMTGEITLSGLVLPVGGIKEKVLAARRAGIKKVMLPKDNEADLRDLPANVRAEMEIVLAERIDEVLQATLPEVGHRLQPEPVGG